MQNKTFVNEQCGEQMEKLKELQQFWKNRQSDYSDCPKLIEDVLGYVNSLIKDFLRDYNKSGS